MALHRHTHHGIRLTCVALIALIGAADESLSGTPHDTLCWSLPTFNSCKVHCAQANDCCDRTKLGCTQHACGSNGCEYSLDTAAPPCTCMPGDCSPDKTHFCGCTQDAQGHVTASAFQACPADYPTCDVDKRRCVCKSDFRECMVDRKGRRFCTDGDITVEQCPAGTATCVDGTCQCSQWMFSAGGGANFKNLAVGPPLAGLRFGDFNGDGKTDVFVTEPRPDGTSQWLFSPGGSGDFQKLAVGPAVEGLRFGDFDGDGKTDVFATEPRPNGTSQWLFYPGGSGTFQKLAVGPAVEGLRFGDFDGDGKTDVFATEPGPDGTSQWLFSPGGSGNFQTLAHGPSLANLEFGDFDGDKKTDVFAVSNCRSTHP
jgi:FG-GAP-like repeat